MKPAERAAGPQRHGTGRRGRAADHARTSSRNQLYLEAAPGGVDARYAWTWPGGGGAGVSIIDCEWGWRFDHEDLTAEPGRRRRRHRASTDTNHGTAVHRRDQRRPRTRSASPGICPDAFIRAAAFSRPDRRPRSSSAADRLRRRRHHPARDPSRRAPPQLPRRATTSSATSPSSGGRTTSTRSATRLAAGSSSSRRRATARRTSTTRCTRRGRPGSRLVDQPVQPGQPRLRRRRRRRRRAAARDPRRELGRRPLAARLLQLRRPHRRPGLGP